MSTRDVAVDDVVVAGGVILNQPPLFDSFVRQLGDVLPDTLVHSLDTAPVHGALRLTERLAVT
jgi:hypothetical protein